MTIYRKLRRVIKSTHLLSQRLMEQLSLRFAYGSFLHLNDNVLRGLLVFGCALCLIGCSASADRNTPLSESTQTPQPCPKTFSEPISPPLYPNARQVQAMDVPANLDSSTATPTYNQKMFALVTRRTMFYTPDSAEAVSSFYVKALPNAGWSLDNNISLIGEHIFGWQGTQATQECDKILQGTPPPAFRIKLNITKVPTGTNVDLIEGYEPGR